MLFHTYTCLYNHWLNTRLGSDISFNTCSHFGIIVFWTIMYNRTHCIGTVAHYKHFHIYVFGRYLFFNVYTYEKNTVHDKYCQTLNVEINIVYCYSPLKFLYQFKLNHILRLSFQVYYHMQWLFNVNVNVSILV